MKHFAYIARLLLVFLLGAQLVPAHAQQSPAYEWAWAGGGTSANPTIYGNKIAIDGAGNSFTVGFIQGGAAVFESTPLAYQGSSDIFLTKHNPQGRLQWVRQLAGPRTDWGYDVAADAAGDVYVTGSFTTTITIGNTTLQSAAVYADMFLTKYSSQGNLLWVRQSSSTTATIGLDLVLDGAGEVYLMGTKWGGGSVQFDQFNFTNNDSTNFVAHYNRQGVLQWVKMGFGGRLGHIVRSNDGNFYISGEFRRYWELDGTILPRPAQSRGLFLAKFDAQFNCLWVRYGYLDLSYYENIGCRGLAADPATGGVVGTFFFGGPFTFDGHLFNCTGGCFPISANRDTGTDVLVLKYDAQGQFLWSNQGGGPLPLNNGLGVTNGLAVGQSDNVTRPSVDASGNTYVVMWLRSMPTLTTSQASPRLTYCHLVSYTPAGSMRWTKQLPISGPTSSFVYDMVCSPMGALYVTGHTYGPAIFDAMTLSVTGTYNVFTAKLTVPDAPNTTSGMRTIPTIITPNGDDQNETFRLPGLSAGPWQLSIYSRWGSRVYHSDDYAQDWNAPGLPDGQYYYYLQAPNKPVLKGWLEVIH